MDDIVFQIANSLALLTWIVILLFTYKTWLSKYVIGIVITVLAILYASLIFTALGAEGGFTSLDKIMAMFSSKRAVLVGWIHYLAFDLMTGLFIINSAKKHGINKYLIFPALIFTFMLGPVGLLIFLIIRYVKTGKLFHDYL